MQKCSDTEQESVPERGRGCQHPPCTLEFHRTSKAKHPLREFKQFCPQQKSSKIPLFTLTMTKTYHGRWLKESAVANLLSKCWTHLLCIAYSTRAHSAM